MTRFIFLLSALLLAACSQAPREPAREPSRIALTDCELEGVGRNARCGELVVPENADAPEGRKIELHIAILPAISSTPKPDPIFILAGGPGQAATQVAGATLPFLSKLRRERDLVYIDQRGTGDSNALDCDLDEGHDTLDRLALPEFSSVSLKACLANLDADPRFYTTVLAVRDFEAVRAALGYPQVNLWGVSYGTRAALEYVRAFPERVRSAVLDGVAPTAIKLPLFFPRDGEAALLAAFDDCGESPACERAFPHLRADYESLLARLAKAPLTVRVAHPRTGEFRPLEMKRETVQGTLRAMLYSPDTAALIPLTLREALAGNFQPLVTQGYAMSDRTERTLSMGLFLSVVCSEDLPRITPRDEEQEAPHRLLDGPMLSELKKACSIWPRGEVPPAYFEPVKGNTPLLILSGRYDPATPPAWGETVAKNFTHAKHVVARVGHNVSNSGCAATLITRFVNEADAERLDTACLDAVQRPPFFTDFAGPDS